MGVLAPVSSWIPEDDLLLKNAIEAGASLESLAKGAVQFSRKFTFWELQNRWYSLLYDPVISEEASSHMIEFEHSSSTSTSKFGRSGNSKDNKNLSGKRKSESVRTCYYALRKRICNEPINSLDLGFLFAPAENNYSGNGDESGNYMLGEAISNHLGFQETNLDPMHCAFPQVLANGDPATGHNGTAHVFHRTMHNQIEGNFSAQAVNIQGDMLHMVGENSTLVRHGSGIGDSGNGGDLPVHNLFQADDLMMKPISTFDQINSGTVNVCSEFEENQVFNSPIAECDASFQNLEYPSPLPDMSIWKDEGLSASVLTVNECLREEDAHAQDRCILPDVSGADNSASGHTIGNTVSELNSEMLCDQIKDQTASTEGYLVEITNTLLNDEPFFIDVDGKDVMEKSYYDGLSSLLLSSPNGNHNHIPEITEQEITQNDQPNVPGACPGELDNNGGSCIGGGNVGLSSEVQLATSTSTSNSQPPEMTDGVICCTLNTEDIEIPCNDDIIFLSELPTVSGSSAQQSFKEAGNPSSAPVKHSSGCQKTSERGSVLKQRDQKGFRQPHAASQVIGSKMKLEKGQRHVIGNCKVKPEDSSHVASKSVHFACGDSTKIDYVDGIIDTIQPSMLKDGSKEDFLQNHLNHNLADSLMEKPAVASDGHNSYPQSNANCIKQEFDAPEASQGHQASEVEPVDIISRPVVEPSTDLEELPLQSDDDDVPYFSDIEAMVLNMDLDPEDHNLYEQEVARYQHEDTKRAIIRLEQCACSHMQRAIASHGAFAILYGRHSKHYIKKPEVILGRATEEFSVDIDLGREGRPNKISRRQATINMEKDGSFHLKNLGKCPVSVNNQEIPPGHSLNLSSSCLIEIRDMPFIFEINQTCVKRYLDGNIA
ncbi:hypothetical protein SLEP1_g4089 [Rubroshorea leprosula]|uniref:FHA domain-containing protein n=1 Tax=Rubroshorea leprosula TaxID=152421 RepID=A0AAV5HRY3_9ROSI|nr:hypothetical protein SLEP1_g4089 [Rubroshorea leprosula]